MAFTYGFYNALDHDRLYDAEQISSIFDGIIEDGIFATIQQNGVRLEKHFQVTASSGMTVQVDIGRAWFNHTWNYNDAPILFTLADSEVLKSRYDVICLKVDRTTTARENSIVVIQGTSAATPELPTITDTETVFYHPLAYIRIGKDVTEITTANITNAIGISNVTNIGPEKLTGKGSPYVTGPLETLDADQLINDWRTTFVQMITKDQSAFETWWASIEEFFKGSTVEEVLAQFATRILALEDKSQIIVKITVDQALVGQTITAHNETYSCDDVTVIVPSTKIVYLYLNQIGKWKFTESYKKSYVYKNIPYFGQYYITMQGGFVLYGFRVKKNVSNPSTAVEYCQTYYDDETVTCTNANFTPAGMNYTTGKFDYGSWAGAFFLPHPVMLNADGTEAYNLDPDDLTKKEDGTASDISSTTHTMNAMQAFPLAYVRRFSDSDYYYCYISDVKYDDNFTCYAHINYKDEIIPYFYRAIYSGCNVSNKLRSLSGRQPINMITIGNCQAYARANYTAEPIWNIECISDWSLIQDYIVMLGKNLNSQAQFGNGHYIGGSSASSLLYSGRLNTKGQFYGTNGTGEQVKALGIESIWANQWRWLIGRINNKGTIYVKNTYTTIDGSSTTDWNYTGSGYISNGAMPNSSENPITAMKYDNRSGWQPLAYAGGSTATYFCDGMWNLVSNVTVSFVGGSSLNGLFCGVFALALVHAASNSGWNIGAAPTCKPALPEEEE